jgi:hypothetical protein
LIDRGRPLGIYPKVGIDVDFAQRHSKRMTTSGHSRFVHHFEFFILFFFASGAGLCEFGSPVSPFVHPPFGSSLVARRDQQKSADLRRDKTQRDVRNAAGVKNYNTFWRGEVRIELRSAERCVTGSQGRCTRLHVLPSGLSRSYIS